MQQLQRPASQRSAAHQPSAADASTLTGKLSSAGPLARQAALAVAATIRAARPGHTGTSSPRSLFLLNHWNRVAKRGEAIPVIQFGNQI